MTVSEVLQLLESKQDQRGISHFNKLNLNGLYSYGIGITRLRAIAKGIKMNHALAMELVETDCFDAILLSSLIADPKKYSRKDVEKHLKRNGNWLMTYLWVGDLLYKTSFAEELIAEWLDDKLAKKRCIAWNLIYSIGQNTEYGNDEEYKRLLKKIVKELQKEDNFVKDAMNSALFTIGKRNLELNQLALKVAQKIGKVVVDYGDNSCEAMDCVRHLSTPYLQNKLTANKETRK
jgi:3-methyladenine DNA glycosylase AlkD